MHVRVGSQASAKSEIAASFLYRNRRRQHRVAVDQIIREIVTKKKGRGINPASATVPTLHAWRGEKNLAHFLHGILRNRDGRKLYLKQLCSLNKKLKRTFDLAPDDPLGIEFARAKNFPQERPDFVVVGAKAIRDRVDGLRRRIVLDEIEPDFSANKLRACRLSQQHVDNIIAIQWSSLIHERFWTPVMLESCKSKLLRTKVDMVTRERSRCLADVLLGVIADADGEKFH